MFRAIAGTVMRQEKAGSRTGFCMVIIIENASLYFGTVEEEFQRATFFSLFFVASANHDFRDLALGRHSTYKRKQAEEGKGESAVASQNHGIDSYW
jgi:hypothetical protein